MSKATVVIELLDEIRRLEDTVLYLQNSILRKRIAIAELLNRIEVEQDAAPVIEAPAEGFKLDGKIFEAFLNSLNGEAFSFSDVADFVCEKLPFEKRTRVYQKARYEVTRWLREGRAKRSDVGFIRI